MPSAWSALFGACVYVQELRALSNSLMIEGEFGRMRRYYFWGERGSDSKTVKHNDFVFDSSLICSFFLEFRERRRVGGCRLERGVWV